MNSKEKEIISLMKEWKDEIKQLTKDYDVAISTLDKSRVVFEKQTKGFLQWVLVFAPHLLTLLIILAIAGWLYIGCGSAKIPGGYEISKPCN